MYIRNLLLGLAMLAAYSSLSAQVSIDFRVLNGHVNGNFYEFDIFMRATSPNTFHTRGLVYFSYNTAAFGTSIQFNNAVSVIHDSLLFDTIASTPPAPKYTTQGIVDNSQNILAIDWRSNFVSGGQALQGIPITSLFFTESPLRFRPLYHIKIDMINTSQPANIILDIGLMTGEQFYISPTVLNETAYIPVPGNFPVEFLFFNAEETREREVSLDWATAQEINNKAFHIQRAVNGSVFETIEVIEGKGQSNNVQLYKTTDFDAPRGLLQYRLKQVDLDGTFSYSETVKVFIEALENNYFTAFPIPAQHIVKLQAYGELEGDYKIQLMDLQGRKLMQTLLKKDSPNRTLGLDISRLPAGVYIIKSTYKKSWFNRIIKQ